MDGVRSEVQCSRFEVVLRSQSMCVKLLICHVLKNAILAKTHNFKPGTSNLKLNQYFVQGELPSPLCQCEIGKITFKPQISFFKVFGRLYGGLSNKRVT